MPLARFGRSAALMAVIVIAVLGAAAASGQLAPLPAAAAAVILIAVQGFGLRYLLAGSTELHRRLEQLPLRIDEPITPLLTTSPAAVDLWQSIARLIRLLHDRAASLRNELVAANAIFVSFPDPLLVIDERRAIIRVNSACREFLGDHLEGRDLAAAIRNPAILAGADSVLASGGVRLVEFDVSAPVERSFRARIERIEGGERRVVVALTDLTMLKRSEQLRADFVANASHELRTPLSTIIGFIETLEGPAAEDSDARGRFLPIMRHQASRMARLVDDLLSLSRIELHEHMPPRDEVEIDRLLRSVAQTLEMKAAGRTMRLDLVLTRDPVVVLGDQDQLGQVFQNLIENAIKYGNDGTPITVAIGPSARVKEGVAISIRDRGDGIARQHLPRLTERFYRVDSARSRAMGGTGLGLAIVKHIVSRHRGQLEIDSEVGTGSVFTVHLPKHAAGIAKPAPIAASLAGPDGK